MFYILQKIIVIIQVKLLKSKFWWKNKCINK